MNRNDPYDPPGEYLHECRECGQRAWTESRIGECDDCGGEVKNLAIPRE
jgi:rRNA maturation endonuclease Nob1